MVRTDRGWLYCQQSDTGHITVSTEFHPGRTVNATRIGFASNKDWESGWNEWQFSL